MNSTRGVLALVTEPAFTLLKHRLETPPRPPPLLQARQLEPSSLPGASPNTPDSGRSLRGRRKRLHRTHRSLAKPKQGHNQRVQLRLDERPVHRVWQVEHHPPLLQRH